MTATITAPATLSTADFILLIWWTNESHLQGRTPTVALSPPAELISLTSDKGQVCQFYRVGPSQQTFHEKLSRTHGLTLPMASAMASTMPPTIPPSLAASFRVTMMSSTASFISWEASEMASWVWHAWGHSGLINALGDTCLCPARGNVEGLTAALSWYVQ